MKFIVRVVDMIDREYPTNSGRWYLVEPENRLLYFFWNLFFQYSPHLNKKDAIEEARLRNKGEWKRDYENTVRIIEVNKNG